jgi:adenylate kinase family enzyme
MLRISVVGNSGSGKSTCAKKIAEILGVPHIELDAIHHLEHWEPISPEKFHGLLVDITAQPGWVIDGNYRAVVQYGPVWERADTVVWLDFPRRVVMKQIIFRSMRRFFFRQELWNGNRETLRNLLSWDPQKSVIRWAWTQPSEYRSRYINAMTSSEFSHINFIRLQSHVQLRTWLNKIVSEK